MDSIDMFGSQARSRRCVPAFALGLVGCCALVTGCLRPPATPADVLAQQFNVQPGVPVAPPILPGPVTPAPLDSAVTAPPAISAPALSPAPAAVAPAAPIAAAPAPLPAMATPALAPAPAAAADSSLLLSPGVVVAQVGSTVVMVAGVFGPGQAPLAGRRVEWNLAAGGVGEITAVGSAPGGFFGIGGSSGLKVNQQFAISETFARDLLVARGPAGTSLGDLTVGRGQTWISVSSPTEGASYVTAVAPELGNWSTRQQTGVIHWVDAQWSAAPPAVGPVGSRHVFTTTMTRRTTGEPLAGWHVRYEITGGPSAGFAPDGSRAIEVPSNDLGQASAEIFQPQPEPGSSPILIQVIRPAGIVPGVQRLVVGTAATEQTWTSAGAIPPVTSVPPVTSTPPTTSTPPATSTPPIISTPPATSAPPATSPPSVVTPPPTIPSTPTTPTNPTAPSTPSVPTAPAGPRATLKMSGPSEATVGATATYRIDVTNSGDQPAGGVVVSDPVPDGLTFLKADPPSDSVVTAGTWQWTIGTIQPGQTRSITLDARIERAGAINHCASMRTGDGIAGQDCVTTTVRTPTIEMKLSGPNTGTVGQQVTFELTVVNHGAAPATSLVLKDTFDDGFVNAKAASPIQVSLTPIPPNQGQRIAIKFTIVKAGHLCHTVELTSADGVRQSTQACLDATSAGPPPKPALSLKITGPATAHIGDRVQFTIEAKNTGDVKIANLKIANDYDSKLLEAKLASPTYQKSDSELSWTIANLDPGQTVQERVDFQCLAEGRVCDKASATDGADLMLGDQTCLDISPVEPPPGAGGKLSITAAARANPIKVGAETSFVITVSNAGPNPERKVALVVKIPEQMQYVEGEQPNPTKVSVVDGQTIRFEPIAQLAAGEHLTFEIHAKASRSGDATLHAELTSPTTMQPVATDAKVTIFME